MIITRPDFYDNFRCSASACSDSCCIGWEIDIDGKSLEKYRNISGELGKNLRDNIFSDGETGSFVPAALGRCPFLNGENLCELILSGGDEMLCDICREHPRFHQSYGNYRDDGLGLCCEEACRLVYGSPEAPDLVFSREAPEIEDERSEEAECLFAARQKLLTYIADPDFDPEKAANYCSLIQDELDFGGYDFIPEIEIGEKSENLCPSLSETAEKLRELEAIDESWTKFSDSVSDNLEKLCSFSEAFPKIYPNFWEDRKRTWAYLVFRYFTTAFEDGDLFGKFLLCSHFMNALMLADLKLVSEKGSFELSDRINTAKFISKEIEYSEENLQLLQE